MVFVARICISIPALCIFCLFIFIVPWQKVKRSSEVEKVIF